MAIPTLKGPTTTYEVGKLIGAPLDFKLYFCSEGGKTHILKIATATAQNPLLDHEAMLLDAMRQEAMELEEAYAGIKKDPDAYLNYQLCFPNLVESFLAAGQGGRRVNVLGFDAVDDLSRLVPIRHLAARDRVRVDRKTSAWMMGKLLKTLAFAHSQGISVGRMTGENILIERDQHYILLFDWTRARKDPFQVDAIITREEIMRAAREVILALGADPVEGVFPRDEHDPDSMYARYLMMLVRGEHARAETAHEEFYSLVRALWSREFWPFTSYSLE